MSHFSCYNIKMEKPGFTNVVTSVLHKTVLWKWTDLAEAVSWCGLSYYMPAEPMHMQRNLMAVCYLQRHIFQEGNTISHAQCFTMNVLRNHDINALQWFSLSLSAKLKPTSPCTTNALSIEASTTAWVGMNTTSSDSNTDSIHGKEMHIIHAG